MSGTLATGCTDSRRPQAVRGAARRIRLAELLAMGLLATGTLALTGARPASALSDEEIFRSFRFKTSAASARELGRGGAVIGLADEASAAWSNPAGLGWTSRPQFMASLGLRDADDVRLADSGTFPLSGLETFAAGVMEFDEERQSSPSFMAYVHPVNDYLVLGISRHELLNAERDGLTTFVSGAFPQLENSAPGTLRQALSSQSSADYLIDSFGISVSSAVVEQLSLGLTVSLARLDALSSVTNQAGAVLDTNGNDLFDTFVSGVDYRSVVDDTDSAFTFTAGLLYKPHRKIGIGLVYRDGPEFEVVQSIPDDGLRARQLREYLATPLPNGQVVADLQGRFLNRISLPDSYGLGVSFGPFLESRGGGGLTISADVVRVEYTDLLDGFVGGLNNQLFAAASQGVTFILEDASEVHLGLEYQWTVGYNNSIRLLLGGYSEGDQALLGTGRLTGVADGGGGTVRAGRFLASGDDEVHVTLGGGFTIKRGFFSVGFDAAADFSDYGSEYAGSATFKF